jgi:aminopeptidase-like protein
MQINKIIQKFYSQNSLKNWAKEIFPYNRSLTGNGNIKTFNFLIKKNKKLKLKFFYSDSKVFDWKVPKQWEIKDGYIKLPNKELICRLKDNNLNIASYSKFIKKKISFKNLKKHIYTIRNLPDAIPYVTLYYNNDWGFCMKHSQFLKLPKKGAYEVFIDSKKFIGKMGYLEHYIPGRSKKEILITSYCCHPSMANNELSGMLVASSLSKILTNSYYSIRIIIVPETIGAIAYINKNLVNIKKNLIAGFNITCIGDNNSLSYIQSKEKNSYADKIIERVSGHKKIRKFSFLNRGSNERQFGCQNLSLPFITVMRSRFGDYKEYHTSKDNLRFISEKNLIKSIKFFLRIIKEIQSNRIFIKKKICEPFLSKYNLYNKTSFFHGKKGNNKNILNFLAYCDKNYDTTELAKICKTSKNTIIKISKLLIKKKLIIKV